MMYESTNFVDYVNISTVRRTIVYYRVVFDRADESQLSVVWNITFSRPRAFNDNENEALDVLESFTPKDAKVPCLSNFITHNFMYVLQKSLGKYEN